MRKRMNRLNGVVATCWFLVAGCAASSVSTPPSTLTAAASQDSSPTSQTASTSPSLPAEPSTQPTSPLETTTPSGAPSAAPSLPAGAIRECDYRPGNEVAAITDADLEVQPEPEPPLPSSSTVDMATTQGQLQILEALDTAVTESYVDPSLNGRDWPALVATYRAMIEAGLADSDLDVVLQALVAELGDEHSRIDSPADVAQQEAELAGQSSFVGVGALFVPIPQAHSAVVVVTLPGSPAEQAGLLPHDSVVAIDGQPIPDDPKEAVASFRGEAGSQVELTIDRPDQGQITVYIVREAVAASLPVPACIVAGTGIGYVMLPNLVDSTMPGRVVETLSDMAEQVNLSGLVIDNRLNTGGSSLVLTPILDLFASGTVGTFVAPDNTRDFVVEGNDVGGSQSLPLAVLVGQQTASFGEVMSGVLQGLDGATVVGTTTDGNVETLSHYDLPDGWRLWLAHEVFVPAQSDYGPWEDTGIIPDIHVPTRWDLFTEATDPALAAAVDALR